VGLVASLSLAQMPKKDKTPRALAVVEMSADGKAAVRLIPVAILISGRFWDASIYRADPRPFALDPGNVYEVERSGKPLGFFTINDSRQTKDQWAAFGNWQAEVEKPAKPAKPTKIQEPADEDRPVLHRREEAQPATKSSESSPPAPAAASKPTAASNAAPVADDPNRPVLRRGKPKPQPEPPPEETPAVANTSSAKSAAPAAPHKEAELLAAISDAGGPDPRPYTYPAQPDEQKKLTKDVTDIAMAEVARYVKSTPALRYAPAATPDQVSVRIFDLDLSNNPHVVLTARVPAAALAALHARATKPVPAPDFFFYVTVVGQTDLYGQMRKLFSSVTDSRRLDASPRLELIDAVDAEGTGRGNLLFRAWSGSTPTYQLYHVGPDSLRKLFDSGGA